MNTLIRRTARLREAGPHGLGRGTRLLRSRWEVIVQADFDDGTAQSFTAGNGSAVAASTNEAHSGTHSLRVSATTSGQFCSTRRDVNVSGLTAGSLTDAEVWIKGTATSTGKQHVLRIQETGGTQAEETTALVSFTMSLAWQLVSVSGALVQGDRTGLALQAFLNDLSVGDEVYYLDDARLRWRP